jgi:hypothetical protein
MARRSSSPWFWLALAWALFWGFFASIHRTELHDRVMTLDELQRSVWATGGPVMLLWALGPPIAAFVAALARLAGSTWIRFALGSVTAFALTMGVGHAGHFRLLYALFGLILLCAFFGVLWIWGRHGEGEFDLAKRCQLAGYVFLFISLWFTCGFVSPQFSLALAGEPFFADPIIVMIYAAIGWVCILLSHWLPTR